MSTRTRGNEQILVTIPGQPVAQGRPRITTIGGRPRAFDPAKSRSWKGAAQVHMQAAMVAAGLKPLDGPLRVSIVAIFSCPRSSYRKREPRSRRWNYGRPDAENIAKAVLDAGNGTLYNDDAQVVELVVSKLIGAQGEPARVEVAVEAAAAVEVLS